MFNLAEAEWLVLFTVLVTSFAVCAALILTQRWHGWLSLDHDTQGVQKLHQLPVPRVGGVAIALGLVAGGFGLMAIGSDTSTTVLLLVVCAAPAFCAGLLEDLTKRVSVRNRLLASFASAALAVWLLDAQLSKVDTPGLDWMMSVTPVAILFTCFAVGGVTNAVNIIDGLNGLASGAVALMLAGLGAIAWMHGDTVVLHLCLIGMAVLLGFMLLNYPAGRIFMGDGGAYLAGFWLAECAVLLLARNPEVSTWAALLCCLYPVWETGFSMFRRNVVRRVSSGLPDMKHFHHLVLHRLVAPYVGHARPAAVKHGLASALCWLMVLMCQLFAMINSENTAWLMLGAGMFGMTYQWAYSKLHQTPVVIGVDAGNSPVRQ
jgi:UDP-N-acetylmuramyl pentapeptide phosphotransferase/UDP-N-acetylglucosamine-1-phosphate transferase